MHVLVYRKSLLEEAGVEPPHDARRADRRRGCADDRRHQGPVRRQRRWRRPARRRSAVVGRRRLPHRGQPVRLRQRRRLRVVRQAPGAVPQRLPAARGANRLVRPGCVHQRADGDAADRAVDVPADPRVRGRRRLRRHRLAAARCDAPGRRRCRSAAFSSTVSARSVDVDVAKAFVQWLWVDQTDKQLDFATSYGFHLPARNSLQQEADHLESGPAATPVGLVNENGLHPDADAVDAGVREAYSDARAGSSPKGPTPRPRSPPSKRSSRPSWSACRPVPRRPALASRDDRLSSAAWRRSPDRRAGPDGAGPSGPMPAVAAALAVAPPRRPPEQQPLVLGLRRPVRGRARRLRRRPDRVERRAQPVRGAQHGVTDRVRRPAQLPATCSPTRRSARACSRSSPSPPSSCR